MPPLASFQFRYPSTLAGAVATPVPINLSTDCVSALLSNGACAYAFGNKELVATSNFSVLYGNDDCGYANHKCCAGNTCFSGMQCNPTTNQCRSPWR